VSDAHSYFVNAAIWLGKAIGDGSLIFQDFSTEALGMTLPDNVMQASGVVTAANDVEAKAADVQAAAEALESTTDFDADDAILAKVIALGLKLRDLYDAVDSLVNAVKLAVNTAGLTAQELTDAQALADDLAKLLSDFLIARALTDNFPRFSYLLTVLGLLDWRYVPPDPAHPLSSHHVRRSLRLDRFRNLIRDPETHLRETIGWGDSTFDPLSIFKLTAEFYPAEAAVEVDVDQGEPFLRVGHFLIRRDSSLSPPGLRLELSDSLDDDQETRIELNQHWTAGASSTLKFAAGVSGIVTPPLNVELNPPSGTIEGTFRAFVERNKSARPINIIGGSGLLSMSVDNLTGGAAFHAEWDAAANAAKFEPQLFGRVERGIIKISKGEADNFISKILPPDGVEGDFEIDAVWTASEGLRLSGSGGIDIALPIHKHLGPLTIDTIYLALHIRPTGTLRFEISVAAGAEIGPIAVAVDRICALLDLRFAEKTEANVGPFDISLRFKPPSGLGIVIDAGAVTGGGYIFFDEDAGRYAGVLQLELKGFAIKAIGILDTKLPSGEKGYSFLIIISAEFSPISLAMGFTLNGVGGLAGIHRTMVIAELQAGIRSHATDDILFPQDPIKNAPRIISDLIRFFPPKKSHYIFGPMALIGWGAPTLLTVKLGIILELPPPIRIVLLGQLDCALPDASAAILELHVDILGVLDFGEKSFALDGTIHDSIIGPFSLFGDFAVRLRWGSARTFALAIGGFNPHFQQIPPGFPSLRRMTLALSGGDNPRVTMQCYFALTSNSLQFGSRADVYASEGKFNVSGWIGFDVLILFHPFELRADFTAGFALRRNSKYLAGVQVDATITGPAPWHVWGSASISILFIKASVNFDATIGDPGPAALPSLQIWASLETSMKEKGNWSGVMPVAASQVVSLKAPSDAFGPLIDPVGNITLIERTAPFARRVTRFADAIPNGASRFDITTVTIASSVLATNAWHYAMELFAPAQFEQLSDAQKLSRPSFETMAAGVALADRVLLGAPVVHDLTYRTVVIDKPFVSHDADSYPLTAELQLALAGLSRAALGGMRNGTDEKYVAPGTKPLVTLDDEQYVVANTDDLASRTDIAAAGTKGAVESALDDYLVQHASERGRFTVVALAEAA
jgi:hypothetical protein